MPARRTGSSTLARTGAGERRVSSRSAIVVAGQRIHVGMVHAGRTAAVEAADCTVRVYDGDELLTEIARTTTKVHKPEAPRRKTVTASAPGSV